MTLETRKLTGVPSWPIILLAGAEKVGKTWQAIAASQSDLISRCLWFPIGEKDPDEYGAMDGFDHDRFDLVVHDGTYRSLINALDEALADEAAAGDDAPATLWVLDSGSRAWDVLSSMAQREQYDRNRRKAEYAARNGRQVAPPDPEQKPAVDLWNKAADRWSHIMDSLRAHRGPVIITARMELRTVMDAKGDPTKDKEQKILAHKSLPFDVDAIVEMPSRSETWLTGVRSVKLASLADRVPFKDFSVDELWRRLGLADGVEHRRHTAADTSTDPADNDTADEARSDLLAYCQANGLDARAINGRYREAHGVPIPDDDDAKRLRAFLATLRDEFEPAA